MRRLIVKIILVALSVMVMPSAVSAMDDISDNIAEEITVTFDTSAIRVTGANGQTLDIYNVAGMKVMSTRVEGDDWHVNVSLPKGCYIVKVGTFVRKISIK